MQEIDSDQLLHAVESQHGRTATLSADWKITGIACSMHPASHKLQFTASICSDSGDSYQNHYNMKLHKCFIIIESTIAGKDGLIVSRDVLDAYEQQTYAEYIGRFSRPPSACWLWPTSDDNDKRMCHSEAEDKAFVASYME